MDVLQEKTLDKQIEQAKEIYKKEIPAFKEIGHDFINGDVTNAQFKAASGAMGVYAQRSGKEFMLRLRILSGVLDLKTFKLIQDYAHTYSLDSIHFTTRQTIQIHNLQFDHVIEIMENSLDHNIITRGGGGNFPRNVALSPLSGVECNEAFDVTPYAIFINKYFLTKINTYHLPRKFKVAFSNNKQDTANATIADMGFLGVNNQGKEAFQLYIGGSLGVNGETSVFFDELIQPNDILYHIEALLHLFEEEGDYQNKSKARIRFIVKRMGREAFLQCYKKHLDIIKETTTLDIMLTNEERIETNDSLNEALSESPDVIPQKQNNLYCVVIHPQGGLLKTKDLDNIIGYLETVPDIQIRLTMEESMIVRNLTANQAGKLLELTKDVRSSTKLSRSVSCIGVPTCQIGIQDSQNLLANILTYFNEKEFTADVLPSLHISGCVNSCSRHQVSEIGFQGKKKRINDEMKDAYSIHIGGTTSQADTHLGKEYGDLLADDIPTFLYALAVQINEGNLDFNEYLQSHEEDFTSLLESYLVK